jgi:hypothetical protein
MRISSVDTDFTGLPEMNFNIFEIPHPKTGLRDDITDSRPES